MSASLVGSEMCIRDRGPNNSSRGGPLSRFYVTARAPKGKPLMITTALGPVSYTHLTLPTICSV
eukprot:8217202-Alexandrium_andersonii.AAC.1